jgi:ABC-type lipoprotein release transport system permease subunit
MNNIKVAWFLAQRQLFRNNKKSVALIVAVMFLTFVNLVGTSGLLVGLIEGSSKEFRERYLGDLIISPLANKKDIPDTDAIYTILKNEPQVKEVSVRYIEPASLESNFNQRDSGKRREIASSQIYGINPEAENEVIKLGQKILEGDYLTSQDTGKLLVGKNLLARYAVAPQDAERSMGDAYIGDKILITINGTQHEYVLHGVIDGKTDVSRNAYMLASDLKKISGKNDSRANQISVRTYKEGDELYVKKVLSSYGYENNQKVETYAEGEPKFVKDIAGVFEILGNVIGGVGVVASTITIFIIIYVNAVTRRKYIGIMKGIGISPNAIKISYIFQSLFYCIFGSLFGALVIYFLLIPYFNLNPINFPFSDGILVAPYYDTFIKFLVLLVATLSAGYFPARSIVKGNTLNAILGR